MTQPEFTPSQQQAISAMMTFSTEQNAHCFVLKGYAGTGKTFLLQQLTEQLAQQGINVVLIAPTGRATNILSKRTGKAARTVHSLIYELDLSKSTISASEESHKENKYELIFDQKMNDTPVNTIYIVDESSMLSNKHAPQETLTFGSGKLLDDFMTYVRPKETGRKIIFVGDDAQLPPVQSSHSVALDPPYLREKFDLIVEEAILIDVFRQSKESSILTEATTLRNLLIDEDFNRFPVQANDSDLQRITLLDAISMYANHNRWQQSIFITETNNATYDYSLQVREILGFDDLSSGERLLVIKNTIVDGQRLYNGDFVRVDFVSDTPEIRTISFKDNNETVHVKLKYRDVSISIRNELGQAMRNIQCKIFENILWQKETVISDLERRAMIIDFQQRHPHIKQGTNEFKNILQHDPYFNALQVRFGYVITCHKAQGGEWDEVFIDMKYSQSIQSQRYFRWSYTAITRAKETIFFVHLPQHVTVQGDDPFKQVRLLLNDALAPLQAKIINEKQSGYENLYSIEAKGNTYRIKLWHNKKDIITTVQFIDGPNELREPLMVIFDKFRSRSIYDNTRL